MSVRCSVGKLLPCRTRSAWSAATPAFRRHSSNVVHATTPFKLAIIGSGPAGFYSAHRVMTRIRDARIDMFEKLPVPFGLVRYGVAPDHPEVKNCQDKFTEVASSPRFNFAGNVEVGKDISVPELARHYDAVLFAYGASRDRTLGVPGEDLDGVYSARAFVGWYNGLPEFSGLAPKLDISETAVIIGHGNVALDVARTLLTGFDSLRSTDISEAALEGLAKNRIQRVHVVGRRGPMQASFTVKEVRELLDLPYASFEPIPSELLPPPDTKLPRVPKRMSQLLSKHSSRASEGRRPPIWSLDFLFSPIAFHASAEAPLQLGSINFAHNAFPNGSDPFDPKAKVEQTSAMTTMETGIAFRSVGYKAEPVPGMDVVGISFDNRSGTIPNQDGRIISSSGFVPKMYCAGWVKNGPNGVIATTMEDAFATAEAIAEDWGSRESSKHGWGAVKGLVPRRIDWKGWLRIDAAEVALGRRNGKPRKKFQSVAEMLEASE